MMIFKPIGVFVTFLILIFPHTTTAETKYVVEHIQINVRTGSSVEHKIVATLESGNRVQVLEVDKDWSRVRLADGKEGWILSRFLTVSEPKNLVLERMQKSYNEINNQLEFLQDENKLLTEENRFLKSELVSNKQTLDEVTNNYEMLKADSAEFIEMKASEQEARLKLQELTSLVENSEREASDLRKQQHIRWFLAGAGVLFSGFLIGSISRKKRRKSSLY